MTYCKKIQTHGSLSPKGFTIGMDAFSLIFLFRERRDDFKDYLATLREHNTITFVMDKRAQKEKKEVVDMRKEVREEAKGEATEITSFTQSLEYDMLDSRQRAILEKHLEMKKRDAWCLYAEYVKWLKNVLEELNINLQVA